MSFNFLSRDYVFDYITVKGFLLTEYLLSLSSLYCSADKTGVFMGSSSHFKNKKTWKK